jgi:small GTP-binding protein
MTDEYIIKILTLGDSSVGKTSIILRFTKEKYNSNRLATIGVDFKSRIIQLENQRIKVLIWDTAGQERFKNIASQYYNGGDGAILTFDITNRKSYERIIYWLDELKQKKNLDDMGLVLVGNKSDLSDNREVSFEEAEKFAKDINIKYFETSAEKNIGISDMMKYIVNKCISIIKSKNEEGFRETVQESSLDLSNFNNNKKNKLWC